MNLREEIKKSRNAADVPPVPFPVPEWPNVDGQLFLRTMTPLEADLLWSGLDEDNPEIRAPFATRVLCDANGQRVLADDDALWLSHKELPVIERAYAMGRQVNGLTDENRRGLVKNSAGTADAGSPSSSAGPSLELAAGTTET